MSSRSDLPRHCHGDLGHTTESEIDLDLKSLETPGRRILNRSGRSLPEDRPWVTLFTPTSLDGRRPRTGEGRGAWTEGCVTRIRTELHEEHDAVLVGVGTILTHDPDFGSPIAVSPEEWRILVVDSDLRTPSTAAVVTRRPECTTIVHTPSATPAHRERLDQAGVRLLEMPSAGDGRVALPSLLSTLSRTGTRTLLVEGGPTIQGSFVDLRLVDETILCLRPHILGGDSPPAIGGAGVRSFDDAEKVRIETVSRVEDCLVLRILPIRETEEAGGWHDE